MNTVTLVVNKLVEKYEYTHFEDEYAIIQVIATILKEEFGYTMARFIINEEDFLGDTLDEFYAASGAK
jgi:hypothetical protein